MEHLKAYILACLLYTAPSSGEGYLLVPVKEEENMLGQLEQTYHLEKIFRTDRRSCDMRNEICMYKFRAIDIHNP